MLAINAVIVTDKMITNGNIISAMLFDASVEKALGGLGGCKTLDLETYPLPYRGIVTKYLDDEIDSVTAIYIVMQMTANHSV